MDHLQLQTIMRERVLRLGSAQELQKSPSFAPTQFHKWLRHNDLQFPPAAKPLIFAAKNEIPYTTQKHRNTTTGGCGKEGTGDGERPKRILWTKKWERLAARES